MGTYDTDEALALSLDALKGLMHEAGVRKLYCKRLAPNDNSKNQPYLGPNLSALNLIPTGEVTGERTRSNKPGAAGKAIFKAPVDFEWLTPRGALIEAPSAKLILYPQYPEARFSGFLQGSQIDAGEWMDPGRKGRYEGRCLFFGITDTRKVVGYLAVTDSVISRTIEAIEATLSKDGVFLEVPLEAVADNRKELLDRLKEIVDREWVRGVRRNAAGLVPCDSPNCGGYTLEACLGIYPNGFSEPDFMGWEVKQYGVSSFSRLNSAIITLMTPEPNGGVYCIDGVEKFVRTYGYQDRNGKADRLNFGGVHRFGIRDKRTNLSLELLGYDSKRGMIVDPDGGIALVDIQGGIAALWKYAKLIEHWKRKHNRAVYIPSLCSVIEGTRFYQYGRTVKLCTGTDFLNVLQSIAARKIYYDPGIKLENASTAPRTKRRSQFRISIKSCDIDSLYTNVELVTLA